jgi:hypothetical protein
MDRVAQEGYIYNYVTGSQKVFGEYHPIEGILRGIVVWGGIQTISYCKTIHFFLYIKIFRIKITRRGHTVRCAKLIFAAYSPFL